MPFPDWKRIPPATTTVSVDCKYVGTYVMPYPSQGIPFVLNVNFLRLRESLVCGPLMGPFGPTLDPLHGQVPFTSPMWRGLD